MADTQNRPSLHEIRAALETAFRADTAVGGVAGATPSAGHCAAVSVIVRRILGGEHASAIVRGQSHWFNRVELCGLILDVDLTGDQFGLPAVQVSHPGEMYYGTRTRSDGDVNDDTRRRADMLAARACL